MCLFYYWCNIASEISRDEVPLRNSLNAQLIICTALDNTTFKLNGV